jgi:hypothetical protein
MQLLVLLAIRSKPGKRNNVEGKKSHDQVPLQELRAKVQRC